MMEQDYIILVDDNPDDAEATQRSLHKNCVGCSVKWLDSGENLISHLESLTANTDASSRLPLLVLLDLNMPGIDGKEVLRKVRMQPAYNLVPIIIFTTSNDPRDVTECYKLGANTFIQKPLSYDKLNNTISALKDYWLNIALLPSFEG